MRSQSLVVALAAVSAAAGPCYAGSASLTLLNTSLATDVVIDEFGRTLVISASVEGSSGETFLYEDGGYTFVGAGMGQSLSADGILMSGTFPNINGTAEAGRWNEFTGVTGLGQLPTGLACPSISSGYGISADGMTLCGLAWDGCSGRAFKWTEAGGMVSMDVAGSGGNRGSHISRDASTIVGFGQGSFSRSPAAWNADDGTIRFFDPEVLGEFWATSADNEIIVGSADGPAAIWTDCSGFIEIPSLPGFSVGQAYDVSADGTTVVGSSGTVLGGFEAFIWTVERGTQSIQDILIAEGVELAPGVFLEIATAVSDDGRTIVGRAFNPNVKAGFPFSGFIVTLPDPEPCPGDFNHDGSVGFADLTELLNTWGPCGCPGPVTCPQDLTGDEAVGFGDLTELLSNWGPC